MIILIPLKMSEFSRKKNEKICRRLPPQDWMLSCVGGIGFNFINFLIAIRRHVIVLPDFYYVCVWFTENLFDLHTHTKKRDFSHGKTSDKK